MLSGDGRLGRLIREVDMPQHKDEDEAESAPAPLVADRRKFLAGAAAAAGAAAVAGGGLIGAADPVFAAAGAKPPVITTPEGYITADMIPGNPYVKAYPELGSKVWIPGYGFGDLPVPTEPGAFLADGLKGVFGLLQRCLCITPAAVLNFVGLGGGSETCRMEGGVGVTVGGGQDNLVQQISNVVLHPIEHITRGFSEAFGGVAVAHDGDRPAPPSLILPIDLDTILHQMIRLVNPANWGEIIGNTLRNPFSIFNEVGHFFYPVQQKMNFHITATCEKFPGVTLVNRAVIPVKCDKLDSFPPTNAPYRTEGPVELVDAKHPNSQPLVVIERFDPTIDHRKGLPPQVFDPKTAKFPVVPN
jgi:hypothetical protein